MVNWNQIGHANRQIHHAKYKIDIKIQKTKFVRNHQTNDKLHRYYNFVDYHCCCCCSSSSYLRNLRHGRNSDLRYKMFALHGLVGRNTSQFFTATPWSTATRRRSRCQWSIHGTFGYPQYEIPTFTRTIDTTTENCHRSQRRWRIGKCFCTFLFFKKTQFSSIK